MFEYELLAKSDWAVFAVVTTLVGLILAGGVYWLIT
jgi:hypothetical protein